jgi:hypothetical protein
MRRRRASRGRSAGYPKIATIDEATPPENAALTKKKVYGEKIGR